MPGQLPPDFVSNMHQLLGDEWEDYLKSLKSTEKTSLRFHPFKHREKLHGTAVQWEPLGLLLDERPSFALDPNWHAGAYYVQESSSMFLGEVVKQFDINKTPIKVLDLCAAPGGKSTHLISILHPESLLVSNEILSKRNKILVENIERWGMPNTIVTQNEAADFRRTPAFFDVILVDAPCSGEGLFRRQPDAILEWSTENVMHCGIRQKTIIKDISPALKNGGFLIYSTCTFNRTENEDIIQSMLNSGDWKLLPIENKYTDASHQPVEGSIKGTFHFYPHKVPGSGFFIAVLQKIKETEFPKNQKYWPSEFVNIKTLPENIKPFIKEGGLFSLLSRKDMFWLIPNEHLSTLKMLENVLRITHVGIPAGQINKGIFTPAHGLAMSFIVSDAVTQIELSLKEALTYLRKETLYKEGYPLGWALASYQGNALGWIKVLPNRFNNYLPASLMLRLK